MIFQFRLITGCLNLIVATARGFHANGSRRLVFAIITYAEGCLIVLQVAREGCMKVQGMNTNAWNTPADLWLQPESGEKLPSCIE